jgi:hypothetical protein
MLKENQRKSSRNENVSKIIQKNQAAERLKRTPPDHGV